MEEKPKATRRKAPQKKEFEEKHRDGTLKVSLKVQKGDREQGWTFNALSPADAVEFATDLCNDNDFRFKRDAIVWEFDQHEE